MCRLFALTCFFLVHGIAGVFRVGLIGSEQITAGIIETKMHEGAVWACNHINKHLDGVNVDGVVHKLELVEYDYDSGATISEIVSNISAGLYLNGTAAGDIHAIIAATSVKNQPIIDAAESAQIPTLHTSGGNPAMWKATNKFNFGLHVPFVWYTRDPIRYAQKIGLKTIAILRSHTSTGASYWTASCIASLNWATEVGLRVVGPSVSWCNKWGGPGGPAATCRVVRGACRCGYQSEVDAQGYKYKIEDVPGFYNVDDALLPDGFSWNVLDASTTDLHRSIIQDIRSQVGVVDIIHNHFKPHQNFVNAMRLEDYTPKMLLGWQGGVTAKWSVVPGMDDPAYGYWAIGFGQWHKAFQLSDPVFGSNAEAVSKWKKEQGVDMDMDYASGVVPLIALEVALRKYASSLASMSLQAKRNAIQQAIGDVNDETMWGNIRFNRNNQNNGRGSAAWQLIPDAQLVPEQLCVLPSEVAERDIAVPFPSWASRFGCPAGTSNNGTTCIPCAKGSVQVNQTAGMVPGVCSQCAAGMGADRPGLAVCSKCSRGQKQDGALDVGICRNCTPGSETLVDGAHACIPCLSGRHNPTAGASCLECGHGKFTDAPQQADCRQCKPGEYSGKGSVACSMCDVGKYQDQAAQGSCKPCGDLISGSSSQRGAANLTECLCPSRTDYRGALGCVTCEEGIECLGDNTAPISKKGYYANVRSLLPAEAFVGVKGMYSVFLCPDQEYCPRGAIGRCAAGRRGISCAECEDFMVPADTGACVACAGSDALPFVLILLGLLFIMCVLYYCITTENRASQPHTLLLIGIVSGMLITFTQQMGVFSTLSIPWENPIKAMLSIMMLMNFDIEVLRIGCVTTFSSLSKFTMKLAVILILLACLVVLHICYVLRRHRGRFWEQMPSLVGAVGTLFMVFFISIVNTSISPLQCVEHPNILQTVRVYPTVICWEQSEHDAMITIGLVFLLIPILFVSGCCHVVYLFPSRMQSLDIRFLHTFAFLLFRFKPEVHWFTIFFILRNLFLALTPVLPDTLLQVATVVILLLVSLTLTSMFFPWRVEMANYLDVSVLMLMVLMMCLSLSFAVDTDPHTVAMACSVFVSVAFLLMLGVICYTLVAHCIQIGNKPFKYFICHHKGGAGAFARLLKMRLLELERTNTRAFIDCDDLQNMELLFEYVGRQCETVVVLMSKELLLRPWCTGELITAHLRQPNVKVAPVIFPEFVSPDDSFIKDYATLVDLSCLGPHGMDIGMAQAMLRWVSDISGVKIPPQLDNALMEQLGSLLVSKLFAGQDLAALTLKADPHTSIGNLSLNLKVAVVADHSNMDMLATALVLCKLVGKHALHDPMMMPHLLPSGSEVPPKTQVCIFVLANGFISNTMFLKTLFQAAKLQTKHIPIVAEDAFRFPSKSMLEELKDNTPQLIVDHETSVGIDVVIDIIQEIFKEIAVVFAPQDYSSTEMLLALKAKVIAKRMLGTQLRTLSVRLKAEADNTANVGMELAGGFEVEQRTWV